MNWLMQTLFIPLIITALSIQPMICLCFASQSLMSFGDSRFCAHPQDFSKVCAHSTKVLHTRPRSAVSINLPRSLYHMYMIHNGNRSQTLEIL